MTFGGTTGSIEQAVLTLMLLLGLYAPTSIQGEHSIRSVEIMFLATLLLLAYLGGKREIDRSSALFISLPIMILLVSCSLLALLRRPLELDPGLFVRFGVLALMFTLNLRKLRLGRVVTKIWTLVNVANLMLGLAMLAGNDWVAEFIPNYYWTSDADLMPRMLSLHKPVLTFGAHAMAGFFLYLFFWVNWEHYRLGRSILALVFAFGHFLLLLGLASFTSLALGIVGFVQMGASLRSPRRLATIAIFSIAIIGFGLSLIADQFGDLSALPQFAEGTFLNTQRNGPWSRYAADGELQREIAYLSQHPLSPIGLERSRSALEVETAAHFFVGDSGPLEYLVRGSFPLLFLLYVGLYRFLKRNLLSRAHALTLFLVILLFETGFSALTASRTYLLLPFLVICLNHIVSEPSMKGGFNSSVVTE